MLALLPSNNLFATPRYSCRELSNRNFLKQFDFAQSGVSLLRQLIDDQVEAMAVLPQISRNQKVAQETCIQKRWAHIAEIVRRLNKEQLKKAETHVLLARMKSLQGSEDGASQSLRLALRLDPKNIEALHYSAKRARNSGNRDLERTLLRSIVSLDTYKKNSDLDKIFEESFERYSYLASSSETLDLIEGPWKDFNKSSLNRLRRALEVSEQLKDPARMKKFFEEMWGRGDIGIAPDWALYHWANMKMLEGHTSEALVSFDRYVKKRNTWDQEYCKQINAYLDLAEKNQAWIYLRRWTELILKQECVKRMADFDKARITALHLRAIEMGAVDRQKPVKDLDEAQILNNERPELTLFMVELLLGQHKSLRPEAPYGKRAVAFKRARAYLAYLQAANRFLADAAFWIFWMEWRLGRWNEAKENADTVLLELQKGNKFYSASSRDRYWNLLGELVRKIGARREYLARLKHLASDSQVPQEERRKAQDLYDALRREGAS